MTVEEKVGQLFVVDGNGVYQNDASPCASPLKRQVEVNRVGGVMWRRSNVYETAILNAKLQAAAKIPLLVSADLEAGAGMRFEDVTHGPWAMAVAATGDVALAERYARATAAEARALGISQVYAPVADVNVNPDNPVINVRSFGEDPQEVARFVAATVKGLQSGPGRGDAEALPRARRHGRRLAPGARRRPGRPGAARLRGARPVPGRHRRRARSRSWWRTSPSRRSTRRRPRRSARRRRTSSTR